MNQTMHPTTAARAARVADALEAAHSVSVWDAPVRVFHWLFALSFAVAWLTAESERWRLVHVTAGYTFGGLLAFRLAWGIVGTRYARFSTFVRGPRAALRYLHSLMTMHPEHHIGHNPAGAWAILAMLGLGALIVASGWVSYEELAGDWANELHESLASGMLALAIIHVAAVMVSGWLHGDNLVRAMITGCKRTGERAEPVKKHRLVAAVLLVAVLAFWAQQLTAWVTAPSGGPAPHSGGDDHAGAAGRGR